MRLGFTERSFLLEVMEVIMMNRVWRWAGVLVVAVLAVRSPGRAQSDIQPVYGSKCQPCHGATGAADTMMGKKFGAASFSSPDVMKAPDAELLAVLRNGKGKMPAWGNKLTEAQQKDLITYIRGLQGKH